MVCRRTWRFEDGLDQTKARSIADVRADMVCNSEHCMRSLFFVAELETVLGVILKLIIRFQGLKTAEISYSRQLPVMPIFLRKFGLKILVIDSSVPPQLADVSKSHSMQVS